MRAFDGGGFRRAAGALFWIAAGAFHGCHLIGGELGLGATTRVGCAFAGFLEDFTGVISATAERPVVRRAVGRDFGAGPHFEPGLIPQTSFTPTPGDA